jgi:hypothetical protein
MRQAGMDPECWNTEFDNVRATPRRRLYPVQGMKIKGNGKLVHAGAHAFFFTSSMNLHVPLR